VWSLEYEYVEELTKAEYLQRMLDGWRRFGHMLFHPACANCQACRPLRVRALEFRPDRSQRRCVKANEGAIELVIGPPSITEEKLDLYDRYHAFQVDNKSWPDHGPKDPDDYIESYVWQPFEVEEWCYYREGKLIGVGYIDCIPDPNVTQQAQGNGGLSAIYFYYDPDERERGLGTWNVLSTIEEARRRGLPYVYLGYSVDGCRSMEYKARFVPNERRDADGVWRVFRR
jgi:arginine-tRNA-protein transferase